MVKTTFKNGAQHSNTPQCIGVGDKTIVHSFSSPLPVREPLILPTFRRSKGRSFDLFRGVFGAKIHVEMVVVVVLREFTGPRLQVAPPTRALAPARAQRRLPANRLRRKQISFTLAKLYRAMSAARVCSKTGETMFLKHSCSTLAQQLTIN